MADTLILSPASKDNVPLSALHGQRLLNKNQGTELVNEIMTNATVKSRYEANGDTNAFTDTEKSKLAGLAGVGFGTWGGSYVAGTVYQAPSNGFITVKHYGDGVTAMFSYETGSSAGSLVERAYQHNANGYSYPNYVWCGLVIPVKKDYFWRINTLAGSLNYIYFMSATA